MPTTETQLLPARVTAPFKELPTLPDIRPLAYASIRSIRSIRSFFFDRHPAENPALALPIPPNRMNEARKLVDVIVPADLLYSELMSALLNSFQEKGLIRPVDRPELQEAIAPILRRMTDHDQTFQTVLAEYYATSMTDRELHNLLVFTTTSGGHKLFGSTGAGRFLDVTGLTNDERHQLDAVLADLDFTQLVFALRSIPRLRSRLEKRLTAKYGDEILQRVGPVLEQISLRMAQETQKNLPAK